MLHGSAIYVQPNFSSNYEIRTTVLSAKNLERSWKEYDLDLKINNKSTSSFSHQNFWCLKVIFRGVYWAFFPLNFFEHPLLASQALNLLQHYNICNIHWNRARHGIIGLFKTWKYWHLGYVGNSGPIVMIYSSIILLLFFGEPLAFHSSYFLLIQISHVKLYLTWNHLMDGPTENLIFFQLVFQFMSLELIKNISLLA